MTTTKRTTTLAVLLCMALAAFAQDWAASLTRKLKDPNSKRVLVVAHRGDWRNAPENSLQAFKNCIDMGVDMIEIDLKKSKDNQLIIMHDQTLDRTTDGKGLPEDFTLAELQALHLKNGTGVPTAHRIPTLEEVLLLAKGKILVNIDKGYDYFQDVYDLLVKTGTVNQVIVKSGYPFDKVKAENGAVLDKVVFMPIVNLDKPEAEQMIEGYEAMRPVAIECCFREATPEVLRLLKKIRDKGTKVWLNALWPWLNGGHDDDRAVEGGEKDPAWGWLLDNGASLIQTDRPKELIDYLKAKQRR